jgi:hypothetical protein
MASGRTGQGRPLESAAVAADAGGIKMVGGKRLGDGAWPTALPRLKETAPPGGRSAAGRKDILLPWPPPVPRIRETAWRIEGY